MRRLTILRGKGCRPRSERNPCNLTRSEVWELAASAMGSDPVMMRVDFIKPKPGKENDYFTMERKIYQKLHKAHIDAGEMNAWWFLSRVFPAGTDSEYDFVTINALPEKEGKWTPDSQIEIADGPILDPAEQAERILGNPTLGVLLAQAECGGGSKPEPGPGQFGHDRPRELHHSQVFDIALSR